MVAKERHGMSGTRIYDIWRDMRHRCTIPGMRNYKHYGGRGISVCKEWDESFLTFYKWAMENGYNDNLSIDRIDVNGNYEPSNCRWTNHHVQMANRRGYSKSGYIGVYLHAEGSCYFSQIRIDGKVVFNATDKSKNACAEKRNNYILENNLHEYPLNVIRDELEDIRDNKHETVYKALDKETKEVVTNTVLKKLAENIGVHPFFVQQCISGKRNSRKYIFSKEVIR